MLRKGLFIVFAIYLAMLTACNNVVAGQQAVRGSGKIVSETRPVSNITAVNHGTIGDLTITLGDQETLIVEAEENLLSYLETPVTNGTLTIRNKSGASLNPTRPVRYQLTVKALQSLSNSSTGNILAPVMNGQDIAINLNSTGNITVDGIQADTLKVNSSSTGDITIKGGQVGRQEISLSSTGKYQADGVKSQSAQVTIRSSGDATLWVTGRLDASISSSGNIKTYGSPQITQHLSSSGKVVGMGNK